MTSYQSRLRQEARLKNVLDHVAFFVVLIAFIVMTIAYVGAQKRHEQDRVGLLTCQEFLSDLESSEIFEE